jgi:hypothetical protein
MSNKFNREYILKIEIDNNKYIEIKSPFTLEFNIVRNNLAATNTGNFVVYNLNQANRSKIYKDINDFGQMKAIQLFAGYNDGKSQILLPRCFNGEIRKAFSNRVGPDFKTTIEAYDGTIAMNSDKGNTNITLPAGTSQNKAIETIAAGMTGIMSKTIGRNFTDLSARALPLTGNPMDSLTQITQNKAYIDSGNLYALDESEVVAGEIRLINADNGLLGTPRKQQTLVEIEMLFEPRLVPSQLIELQSLTEKRFNGTYKITGITHKGVISGAIGGDCRTNVTMTSIEQPSFISDKATTEYRIFA